MMRTAIALSIVAAAQLAGCTHQHMTATYGRSESAAFRAQAVQRQRAAPPEALLGLDSQEATIIANSYRASLGQKAAQPNQNDQVLILPPPGSEQQHMPLAPSVPR
ncbi:MAG TPA: hypothetical protein VM753_22980 [Anaeromyxobacter sp.]|jgi:hypothetical protein|nr:hypothetical protein [Anaeromyxobacter sp.]